MDIPSLPTAAKTQTETASYTNSYGALPESGSKPSQDVSPNDRSPLLEVHPQQKISDNSDRKGNTSSFSSSIRNNLDFKSIVHRISSVNGNAKKINRALSDTGLDLITSAEQVDFTAWLDEQFKKIDSFYKEKEKEAVERYLMLQDQLFNLREQKISARVAKAQAKPSKIKIPSNTTATKTKKKIAHNIDLPSLPASIRDALFAQTKKDHDKQSGLEEESAEEGEEISRDYVKHNKDDNHIPYPVARRQIKIAIGEFYRSLELLESYQTLNQTAFRKMTKKFDKMTGRSLQKPYMEKVNSSYFCQSEIVDDLIRKTEDMFAMYFENGNRKHAVEKLRAKSAPEDHYIAMFITGLSYGLSVPLLIQAVVKGVDRIHQGDPDAQFLFQIWGGFFLVLLMLALFQINCLIWKLYKINYSFIFEFHPLSQLDAKEMAVVPSVLVFLLAILMWLCFYDFWPGSAKVSFFVALSEVFRRFIWAFFRVENEHCSNVQRFRASRDVSLPYQIVTRRVGTSVTTPELFRSSRIPTNDEEAQIPGIEVVSSENETTTAISGADAGKPPKSTFSAIAAPVIQALNFAIRNAHTREFQRHKDSVASIESSSSSNKVDSDDEDSDDDDVNNENAEAASVSFGVNGPIYQHETSHSNGHRPSYFKQPSSVKWRDQYL
ncbi:hypothetical protein DV113_003917 [Geotrichum candidum]|nr:hypothetical protein DV452_002423 [Geotrichum candidum]KAF7498052.1 hypothetical protein DV113_003917 [Geotrichum candidum]KAI8133556.1 hypothetical protein DUD61_002776 [Geotrichum candidum]